MVDHLFPPFLSLIKHIVLKINWNSQVVLEELGDRLERREEGEKEEEDTRRPYHTHMMFISGRKDELVPCYHMDQLHSLALRMKRLVEDGKQQQQQDQEEKKDVGGGGGSSNSKQGSSSMIVKMFEVQDGTHNDTWYRGKQTYYKSLFDFLREVFPTAYEGAVFRFNGSPLPSSTGQGMDRSDGQCEEEEEEQQQHIPTMTSSFNVK